MVKIEDEHVQKTDEAKGEVADNNKLEKAADEAALKSQKTEQKFDRDNNIFTK